MLTSLDLLDTRRTKVVSYVQVHGADIAIVTYKGSRYKVITDHAGTEITKLGKQGGKRDTDRQTAVS